MYLPDPPVARYLQYHYLAASPYPFGKRDNLDDAGDGSEYNAVHKKYHPFFRDFARRFGYDDLMLIDPQTGDVVYSAEKTTEFGTSLSTGPYADSNLADLVGSMRKVKDRQSFHVTRFELYRPELARPASFVGAPISDGTTVLGLLILQLPIHEINRVMTGNHGWERDGLGQTGEVILVGSDHLMRSVSRFYAEDPEAYLKRLKAAGYPEKEINKIRRAGTTIMTQAVQSQAEEKALAGEKGTEVLTDYRNERVLVAYAPLELETFRLAIVAKMDESEAFAPATALRRQVIGLAVAIALAAMLLAAVLAHFFTRPIGQLIKGARRLSAGESDVQVAVSSRDELGELAAAFNEMARSLKHKNEMIEQKVRENEELLLNILPGFAAARLKEGERQIAEEHADVTVLFADIAGFEELTNAMHADEAVRLLNNLIGAFDEAAERHGVEKVKTIGSSYMAVCGMSVQRPDHPFRMVEFAQEMLRVVRHFNHDHASSLSLQVGINAGPVAGGLVGRTRFIYDLWGETVNVARAIRAQGKPNSIQVTRAVHDRLRDQYAFDAPVEVELPGKGTQPVWTVPEQGAGKS
jgi:class 3 adenylate cyclase